MGRLRGRLAAAAALVLYASVVVLLVPHDVVGQITNFGTCYVGGGAIQPVEFTWADTVRSMSSC